MHVRIFLFEISKFKVLTTTHNDESFISSVYFNGVATSPFVALISLSLNNIERDQEAIIHGSIAPVTISPRQPPGNVYSFRPAAGGFLQLSCSRWKGEGQSKLSTRRPWEARHFTDRVEKYFQGKCPEFVAVWLELSNLSRKKKMANPRGYARRGW